MTGQRKKRIAGSYFVSTLSISLVLVVVGILVFILLNAKLVSDHVKQNIGFSIIVKDNVNEAEIKKMQRFWTQSLLSRLRYLLVKWRLPVNLKRSWGKISRAYWGITRFCLR